MTRDLGELLESVEEDARRGFDAAHPGDDSALYARVITPLRTGRRLAPLAGVLIAVAVTLAALAAIDIVRGAAGVADRPEPATEPGAALLPDPAAVAGEAGWTVGGLVIDARASAAEPVATVGLVVGESLECQALASFGRLLGGDDWSVAVHLGAFVNARGSVNDVHVRSFESADGAADYAGALARIARACAAKLAPWGTVVEVARVGVTGLAGQAVEVVIPVAFADTAWRLWVYVDGADVIGVVSEPGAPDLRAAITSDWVRGGLR